MMKNQFSCKSNGIIRKLERPQEFLSDKKQLKNKFCLYKMRRIKTRKKCKKNYLKSLGSFYHCQKMIPLRYCITKTLVFSLKFHEELKFECQISRREYHESYFHHCTPRQDFLILLPCISPNPQPYESALFERFTKLFF